MRILLHVKDIHIRRTPASHHGSPPMNTISNTAPTTGGITSWFRRATDWLDGKGRGAWIGAMVLGFVFAWPIGLALVFYITLTNRWSKDMFNRPSCAQRRAAHHWGHSAMKPSGNTAFDAYKAEMLRRLEDEQTAFEGFLQRLRDAKDKSEFDAFMDDRARANRDAPVVVPPTDAARPGEY